MLLNFACIYKFEHTDRESGTEKAQIAVGIVTNQHSSPTTGDFLCDIRFCLAKGAKPAAKNRTDTLYQNINANMAFDLHYKSKVGKKVEQEDRNLPRSVMLTFNFHINKGDGNFSKKRLFTNIYSMSSYSLADNVIREFYGN